MKIITCASYYGTGSSAVTDLVAEFSNIESLGSNFECRLIQDPHGISDLDYYLVENNHRHNSGYAIKKFIKLLDLCGLDKKISFENYDSHFNNRFKIESQIYVNKLIEMQYEGGWHYDLYCKSDFEIFCLKVKNYIFNRINKRSKLTILDESYRKRKISPIDKAISKEKTYMTNIGDDFYNITKEYIDRLFSSCIKNKNNFLMVDQLVPPSNTERYLRYFNDLKIICVDRDPRDLYTLEKIYWKNKIIPSNIDDFIKWFKITRAHLKKEIDNPNKVLRIKFEELIYEYDESLERIVEFLKLDKQKHIDKKKIFNPDISIKNTRVWLKHPEIEQDIEKIEKELSEFCYQIK